MGEAKAKEKRVKIMVHQVLTCLYFIGLYLIFQHMILGGYSIILNEMAYIRKDIRSDNVVCWTAIGMCAK